ncbi:MAG: tetratricopeptide repeat protein [Saprospiraceae bacterium]|nr:tetratricopeptide repeat protein [Saprospiraceae bacterium]
MRKPTSVLIALLLAVINTVQAQPANIDSLKNVWSARASGDSARCLAAQGLVVYYLGVNIDSALWWGEQEIDFAKKTGSSYLLSSAMKDKAIAHQYKGEYEEGLALNQEALQMLGKSKRDQILASTILGNMGLTYSDKKETEKAAEYYKKALALKRILADSIGIARNLNNIGLVYFQDNVFDSALVYFTHTLELSRQLGSDFGIALSLGNIGSVYLNTKQYDKAITYFNQALELKRRINDLRGVNTVLNNLGNTALEQKDYAKARAYYEEALQVGRQVGDKKYLSDTYSGLAKTYAGLGEYRLAYEAANNYAVVQDSIMNELNSETFNEMEVRFQTKEKEAQLAQQELTIARQRMLVIGAVLALVAMGALFQFFRNRQRLRQKEAALAVQLERAETDKLREIDKLKSNFFANISHEFRTPLTLILGPLEQMLSGALQGDLQKYYRIMQRNAVRLLQLVNQLLDLSRLESGRMLLQVNRCDWGSLVRAIAFSFESLAERKQIRLEVDLPEGPQYGWVDRDKLEKILVNLLSNAFKFTHEEGKIEVNGRLSNDNKLLRLTIADNGIGIPAHQLEHLFERFYTTGTTEEGVEGSGIGLALTKELVVLHHGTIEVESKPRQFTRFHLTIPVEQAAFSAEELGLDTAVSPPSGVVPILIQKEEHHASPATDLPMVLIVEDNDDVRNYIAEQLSGNFHTVLTKNGKEGLAKALEIVPDLVITDLMMPEMDGMTLCRFLKQETATSHIPVIMLTAKAEREDKLEGLGTGADDYLVKPFDALELKTRINNLITQRRLLRSRFAGEVVFKPSEVAVTPVDEAFLQRVMSTIEDNLDEEHFSVVELGQTVGMSRSQLHRKLKALTDKGPNEIIRDMRLNRAKELLEKGAGNASEVAYMVGFNSLAYFSKCFSDQFGMAPSDVRKR